MNTNYVYNTVPDKAFDRDSFADLTGFNDRKNKRRERRRRKGYEYD